MGCTAHAGQMASAMDACRTSVCVAVDGPETASTLVSWAVANVVQPSDELSILHVDMKVRRRHASA